ncbi:unnamed protein product [Toxocara canis]|uniref:TIL domain-containing protein n=1 Tax=Toxocara canis TaxID=6265 RepID=A0A183V7R6_TOXCA|nr:unnamed protein product [Toxocara canis]
MEYSTCGTACPEKCTDGGMPGPCTMQCVAGCFCKQGYVLQWEQGPCVPRALCPGVKFFAYERNAMNL